MIPRVRSVAAAEVVRQRGQFHKAHTPLNESSREQALPCVSGFLRLGIVQTVELLRGFGLTFDVAQLRHSSLHAPGHFVVLNGGFHLRIGVHGLRELLVHGADEVELPTLQHRQLARFDVVHGFALIGLDHRSLMNGWKEAVAEQTYATMRHGGIATLQHHIAGQITRLRSEAVSRPSARARIAEERQAGVHEEVALRMLAKLRGHGTDHAQLIRHIAHVGQHVTDGQAAFAVVLVGPMRRLHGAIVVELRPLHHAGHGLTGILFQQRLRIKGVHMRDATAHVAEDDVLRAGFEFRGSRLLIGGDASIGLVAHQSGQSHHAEAVRGAGENVASGDHGVHRR